MSSAASKRIASLASQVESYVRLSSKCAKPLQLVYISSPTWPNSDANVSTSTQIDIGVLDSSFNPPHRAHMALASTQKPTFCVANDDGDHNNNDEQQQQHFDALLLLFSVRNADKGTGKSTDASPAQRLYMMELLARDLARQHDTAVAVGIVEEPLMISKSTLIHDYIQKEQTQPTFPRRLRARLHWLVGFDTLERFFQVKYYPSPEYFAKACQKFFSEERTTFICARRGNDPLSGANERDGRAAAGQEGDVLQSDHVKPWVESGSIVMIDLPESVRGMSSTAVRKQLSAGDADEAELHSMIPSGIASFLLEERLYETGD